MGTGKKSKEERLGATGYNKQGCLMKVVEYNSNSDIIVEFEDGAQVKTSWQRFVNGPLYNPNRFNNRLGMEKYNNQGYLMKIVKYNSSSNIMVEFQDEYKCKIQSTWTHFQSGLIHNPSHPNKYGGILGNKYSMKCNGKPSKEYNTWVNMLIRCYDKTTKIKHPKYKDVTCCKEWLYYPNFYEWIHKQENFEVWKELSLSALDKDILIKGNKVYGPDTCCLVPQYINSLFESRLSGTVKKQILPIGVYYWKKQNKYEAKFNNKHLGRYDTAEEAFGVYKIRKEAYIKQVAQEEYDKGTISKKCYEAMMKWEVEIED